MPNKAVEARRIYRLLTPNNQAHLLAWVRLVYCAENSARKTLGINAAIDRVSISKPREYSRGNLVQRSKK
jgi:hypothetical protein